MYKAMEDALIPEHLTHTIAKRVHQDYQEGVCFQVNQLYSPFERVFREEAVHGVALMEKLHQQFPELEVYVDGYYWTTVVLKLDATKFVVYHVFKEYPIDDNMVADGRYVNGVMMFDRFQYKAENWRKTDCFTSAKAYFNKEGRNYIPFQFTNHVMGGSHDTKDVKIVDAPVRTKWFNTEPILHWFDECKDLIWIPIANEEEHQQYIIELEAENVGAGNGG